MLPVALPVAGAGNNSTFREQPAALAPLGRLRNVLRYPSAGGRPQIGTRPGTTRVFGRVLTAAEGQGLVAGGRASTATGSRLDNCQADDGTGGSQGEVTTITGQTWRLDQVPSLARAYHFDVSGDGGGSANGAQAAAVSRDGLYYAVATNYTVAGYTRAKVRLFRTSDNAEMWTLGILEASVARYVNALCFSTEYLIVCSNQYLLVLKISDGTQVQVDDVDGWAIETVEAAVWTDPETDAEYLFVAFAGSNEAGTCHGGASITAGNPASQFRSGVAKYQCLAAAAIPLGGSAIERKAYGPTLSSSDAFYETTGAEPYHGYFRFSENTARPPYGCLPTSLRVGPDGSVYYTRTNQGYGPNSSYPPDGSTLPPISVGKIAPTGLQAWEQDIGSIQEVGLDGYINDIPTGAGDDPTLLAMDVAPDGLTLCAGGRRNAAGYSIWMLDATTGDVLWRTQLMASSKAIRQGVLRFDPASGNPIAGGDQHNGWPSAGGADAHLWMLDKDTGTVAWAWVLTSSASATALGVFPSGEIVYGSDHI